MKVLASVYACSPYDGSERAVGWNWVYELNKYHEITALTSSVYKNDIEDYLSKYPYELKNTRFVYIEVPNTSWHKEYKYERVYYILWQKEAVKVAKELVKTEKFDLVHHITYVTCVLPTYMHEIGLPFLFGPVAGGDLIPAVIEYPLSCKEKAFEHIRKLSQKIFTGSLNYRKTVREASLILTATDETARLIPERYQNKVEIFQAVGLKDDIFFPEPVREKHVVMRFLMAGRMLYLKGYEIGVKAFVKALDSGLDAELTILGDTENNSSMESYKTKVIEICGKYLNHKIKIVPKVEYSKMKEFYDRFDVLINCSLRDSGCFVVMEAMARGLAVISLDTGGPKVNTIDGTAVKIAPSAYSNLIDCFTEAILDLGKDNEKRERLGKAARKYALEIFKIDKRTIKMNDYYRRVLEKNKHIIER